jgi:serine O-acetyltransferase
MTTVAATEIPAKIPSAREVRERLRRDRERLQEHYAAYGLPQPAVIALHPSYLSVWLYRWSAYNFRKGRRMLARLLWHTNLILTGADLSFISEVGAGLVILHPISTQIFGRIGENCTIWGHGGIGGGISTEDIGAGPGLPIVGNGVNFGARSFVLGPVRIGDNCVLEPGVVVTRNAPAGSVLAIVQSRKVRGNSPIGDAAHGPDGDKHASC